MKTIGLIGGMSWESTLVYYKAINEGVKAQLGGHHSAKIILVSVDFESIKQLQHQGDWQATTDILSEAANKIETAGADALMLCTNTMHKVASEIESSLNIPFLHIADATADILINNQIACVGLLGTSFTMEQSFYKGRLLNQFGIEVLVPNHKDREIIHKVIYEELCLGKISSDSKAQFLRIIDQLAADGAQGIVLGCTEIGMLVHQSDTPVRLFDTTAIHADKAVKFSLT